jgi:hypothetical protein
MNRDVKAVRDLLADHRPAPPPDAREVNARRTATLAAVLAHGASTASGPRLRSTRSLRPAWLVPAAALSVLAAVLLVQFNPIGAAPAAQAATPPLLAYDPVAGTAQDALRSLASKVRAVQVPATADGDIRYTRISGWNLNTRIDGQLVTSVVLPEVRETWRALDGSGRQRVAPGEPVYPSDDARRDWQSEAAALRVRDGRVGPGEIANMYPEQLSTDQVLLRDQLAAGHPAENGAYELLVAVADLYREQLPEPSVRAALLDVLSETADLQLLGETVDRLGRPGLAVAVQSADSGLPTLHSLIFDQRSGVLLAAEQMLTETAGRLNVAVPSVISYTLYEAHGRVRSFEQRPSA